MNTENLFSICNLIAMVGWLALIIAPHWKYTKPIVQLGIIPLIISLLYLYLVVTQFGNAEGGFGSLAEVSQLFENPQVLLAGWIHYLAFDLWVGSWQTGDALKHNIHVLLLMPCLVLTFFFGPIGLLSYILVRTIKTKKFIENTNF